MERAALEALRAAGDEVGLVVEDGAEPGSDVTVVSPDGQRWHFEMKARAVAAPFPDRSREDARLVVVADVVSDRVADALRDQQVSWLDRRGRLRLQAPGLLVDTDVSAQPRRPDEEGDVPGDPFGRGRATIEVAVGLLLTPDEPPGIRELAREVGMSASTVSQARTRLQRASLVTDEGTPLLPELFWELGGRWRPRWFPLASDPDSGLPATDAYVEGQWVATGDVAAAMYGAPLAVTSAVSGRYYVDSPTELRRARQAIGDADPVEAGCHVAVAPSRLVHTRLVHTRADTTAESMAAPWKAGPIAPYVVVALDLATDPARGREIVTSWDRAPDGTRPVWQR